MEWKIDLKYFIFPIHFGGMAAKVYDSGLAVMAVFTLDNVKCLVKQDTLHMKEQQQKQTLIIGHLCLYDSDVSF
jgi:hypothetical protein